MNPDVAVFHLINQLTGLNPLVDEVARFVVNDYAMPTLFAFVIGGLWFAGGTPEERERCQRAVLYAIVAVVLANLAVKFFWIAFFRPRPFAVEEGVKMLFYRPSVSSFPSEPVATLAALAFGVFLLERRVGAVLLALMTVFAFTRVMAGVHYPSDVLAAALLGGLGAYLPYRYVPALGKVFAWTLGLARQFGLA